MPAPASNVVSPVNELYVLDADAIWHRSYCDKSPLCCGDLIPLNGAPAVVRIPKGAAIQCLPHWPEGRRCEACDSVL